MSKIGTRIKAPDPAFEDQFAGPVCGIDEVGRGPLAGPVMAACAFILPSSRALPFWQEIKDSKLLSAVKRETLYEQIRQHARVGIGMAGTEEIDRLNIHHATLLAMKRAFEDMTGNDSHVHPQTAPPQTVLIDGKFAPRLDAPCQCTPIIKGDRLSLSIAAASIVAKVARDKLMAELGHCFPAYGWGHNAGYGTAAHIAAIRSHGVTIHHRRSYAPVKTAIAEQENNIPEMA